jgi:hypothetical protein
MAVAFLAARMDEHIAAYERLKAGKLEQCAKITASPMDN